MAITVQLIRKVEIPKKVTRTQQTEENVNLLERCVDNRYTIKGWTPQECEIFKKNYAKHPKDFKAISSFLDGKSSLDCVKFYYLTKKKENYRKLNKTMRKRRRRGRPRKLKILEDNAQATVDGTSNCTTTTDIYHNQSDNSIIKKKLLRRASNLPQNKKIGLPFLSELDMGSGGKGPEDSDVDKSSDNASIWPPEIMRQQKKERVPNMASSMRTPNKSALLYATGKKMEQLQVSIKQNGSSVTLAQGISQITHVASVRLERLSDEYYNKEIDSCETTDEVFQCDLDIKERQQNSPVDLDENSCCSERTVILENDDREDLESLKDAIIISDSESDIEGQEDTECDTEGEEYETQNVMPSNSLDTADKSIKDKPSFKLHKVSAINKQVNKNSKRLSKRVSRINKKYNALFGSDSPTSSPDLSESRLSPELSMSDDETFEVTKRAQTISSHNDKANESHIYDGSIPIPYSQTSVDISIDERIDGVLKISKVIQTPDSHKVQTDKLEMCNKKTTVQEIRLPEVPVSEYEITSSQKPLLKTLKRKLIINKHYGTSQNKLRRRNSVFVTENAKKVSLDFPSRRISQSVLDTAAWQITNTIADNNHNFLGHKTIDKNVKNIYHSSENPTTYIDSNSPSRNSLICSINIESLDMALLLNCESRNNQENVTVVGKKSNVSSTNEENVTIEEKKSVVSSTNEEMALVLEENFEITNFTEEFTKINIVSALELQTDIKVVEPSNENQVKNYIVDNKDQCKAGKKVSSHAGFFIGPLGSKNVSEESLNVNNNYENRPAVEDSLDNMKEGVLFISSNMSANGMLQIESDEKENVEKEQNHRVSVIQPRKAENETTTCVNKDNGYRPIKHTDRRYVKKHPGKMDSILKRKLSSKKPPKLNLTSTAKDEKACDMPCIDDSGTTHTAEPCKPASTTSSILQVESSEENYNEHSLTSISDNCNTKKTKEAIDYAPSSVVSEHTENIHYLLPHGVVISLDPKLLPATVSSVLTSESDIPKIQSMATQPSNVASPKVFHNTLPVDVSTNENHEMNVKKPAMGSIKVHDESYLRGTGPIFSRTEDIDSLAQKIVVIMRDTQFYKVKYMQAEKLCAPLQERQKKKCYDEYKVSIESLEQECVRQLLDAEILILCQDPRFWHVVSEVAEAFITKTGFFPTFPTSLFRKVITDLCILRDLSLEIIGSNNIQQNGATVQVPAHHTAVTAMTQPAANFEPSINYRTIRESHSAMSQYNSMESCNKPEADVVQKPPENSSTTQSLQGPQPAFSDRGMTVNPLLTYAHNQNNIYSQQQANIQITTTHGHYNTSPMHEQMPPSTRAHFTPVTHQHQYLKVPAWESSASQEHNVTAHQPQQYLRKKQQESFTLAASCMDTTQAPSVKKSKKNKKNSVKSNKVTAMINATTPLYTEPAPLYNSHAAAMIAPPLRHNSVQQHIANRLSSYRKQHYNVDPITTVDLNNVILPQNFITKHPSMVIEPNTRAQSSISSAPSAQNEYLRCRGKNTGTDIREHRIIFEQHTNMDSNQQKTIAQSLGQVEEQRRGDYQNVITSSRQQEENYIRNMAILGQQIGSTEAVSTTQEEVSQRTTGTTNKGQITYAMQPPRGEHTTVIQQRVFSQNNSPGSLQLDGFNPKNHNGSIIRQKKMRNNRIVEPVFNPNNNAVRAQQPLVTQTNFTASVQKKICSNGPSVRTPQSSLSLNNHTVSAHQGAFSPNNRNNTTLPGFLVRNEVIGAQPGGFSSNNYHVSMQQGVGVQQGGFSPNNHHGNMQSGLTQPNNLRGVQIGSFSPNNHFGIMQQGSRPNNHNISSHLGGLSPNNYHGNYNLTVDMQQSSLIKSNHNNNMQQVITQPNYHTVNAQHGGFSPSNGFVRTEQSVFNSNNRLTQCNDNLNHCDATQPTQPPNGLNTNHLVGGNQIDKGFAAQLLRYHNAQVNGTVGMQTTEQQDAMFSQAGHGGVGPGARHNVHAPNVTIQDGMVQINQKNSPVAAKIISNSVERSSRDSGFMSPPNRDNFQSPESSLTSP